jgi:hypothetical protein
VTPELFAGVVHGKSEAEPHDPKGQKDACEREWPRLREVVVVRRVPHESSVQLIAERR